MHNVTGNTLIPVITTPHFGLVWTQLINFVVATTIVSTTTILLLLLPNTITTNTTTATTITTFLTQLVRNNF